MGRRDDAGDVVLDDKGDDVSHTDTIRDYTTNTERYDGRWHRLPTEQEVLVALDALLAENQRLREALEAALPYIDSDGAPPGEAERVYELGREALAGDAE